MTVLPTELTDRGVVSVTGPNAEKLLQGLVTNDLAPVAPGHAAFAGLLSPQGKIQFDFLAVRTADGFLLDVSREKATELVKRLTLYRLRSRCEIADRSSEFSVIASWGEAAAPAGAIITYGDPRLSDLGQRSLVAANAAESAQSSQQDHYHVHRIALGVPEGGRDYAFGDTFVHEALFDQLHGVSFSKGCYVGQEIVSRMEHRGTARKRIVQIVGEAALPAPGSDITAGDVAIGTLGSVAGELGLGLVRLDRAAEFKAKGIGLKVEGVPVSLRRPAFASFVLEPPLAAPVPST